MSRKYFSLLQRIDDQWTIQFGDYDRSIVEAERDDYRHGSQSIKARDLKIISSGGTQAAINAAVAKLNASSAPTSEQCKDCQGTGNALVMPYPGRAAERMSTCPTCSGGQFPLAKR